MFGFSIIKPHTNSSTHMIVRRDYEHELQGVYKF
jgi:hypothetical protein